jgi:hypothetical protein
MSPATKLVRVLNEPGSSLARLLNAKASKGEPAPKEESAPPAEAAATAPATADTESKEVTSLAETKKEEPPATEVTG